MAFVSDNASNIKKAITEEFGSDKWLPCLAHTLNLIPAKLIKSDVIDTIHKKVKSIVKYFKQSVSAADALRLVSELMLIQNVETRWNSTYDMYERFTVLSEKIASILLKCPNGPEMLSASELLTVKEFVDLLKPFKDATTIVSGETYVTGSQAIPVVKNLKIALDSRNVNTDVGRHMKKLLSEEFANRFERIEQSSIRAMATILDPRFKRLYFSDKLACANAVNKITVTINHDILETSKASCENNNPNKNQSVETNDFWVHHHNLVQESNSNKVKQQNPKEMPEEFRYYLNQQVINRNEDLIMFWRQFPDSELSKIAIRYLTVISTSVPSERLFSRAALILTEKRNRLSPKHFQELIFLSSLSLDDWHLN